MELGSFFNLRCGREMTLVVDNSTPAAAPARRSYRRRRAAPRYRRRRTFRRSFRRRRFRRGIYSRIHRAVNRTKFTHAQINPFDPQVDGVKIPDSNTMSSTSLRIEDDYNAWSTDANGLVAVAFIPTLVNTRIDHTAATAVTWTWPAAFGGGADSSKKANVALNYDLFRPCAHGVRIQCSAAPTTITGNLHVAIATASNFGQTTWTFPTSIADMANCVGYRKFPLSMMTQQGVTVVNKFLDCTATRYLDVNSDGYSATGTDITLQTNGWCAIIVAVEGAPTATAVLSMRQVIHVEAIPKISAVDNSTPAAPYNVNVLQQTSRLAGGVSPAFTDAETPVHHQEADALMGEGGMWSSFSSGFSNTARRYAYAVGRNAIPAGIAAANYWYNRRYQERFGNPANTSLFMMGYGG